MGVYPIVHHAVVFTVNLAPIIPCCPLASVLHNIILIQRWSFTHMLVLRSEEDVARSDGFLQKKKRGKELLVKFANEA